MGVWRVPLMHNRGIGDNTLACLAIKVRVVEPQHPGMHEKIFVCLPVALRHRLIRALKQYNCNMTYVIDFVVAKPSFSIG